MNPACLKIVWIRVVLLLALLSTSASQAEDVALAVDGEVKTPLKLTLAEIEAMPSVKVDAKEHDGTVASFQGVPLAALLDHAGAPQGAALRGEALRLCLLVKAADGYMVTFSLAEVDPLFTDKQVLLVYRRNGSELDTKTGPLRLVIPDEKRQSRWVRQVTELKIIRINPD